VDTLTALALHLELRGEWQRFKSPRQLGSWLGLTPSLEQSGESASQGQITKSGSGIARRLLVEAAWHYQRQPAIGATLRNRQVGQPEQVLQIAWRAQHRLRRVHRRMRARGKPDNVATVAVARELADPNFSLADRHVRPRSAHPNLTNLAISEPLETR
jgi:transposase